MASPLRWFRKYSYFFIVVFGVILMAIFGLGSVVSGLNPSSFSSRGGTRAENSTVAEWSGGELKKFDLASLRQRHFASLRFLENVYKYAVDQNGGNAFPVPVEQILPIIRQNENPSIEEMDARIMNRFLFAKSAEQEGFVVDENMVYEYIAQYGGDTVVTKNLLKQLNRQVNQQVPLTAIVRHLQMELLWQQMETMTKGGLPFDQTPTAITAIAPTEALQLYTRTAKKMECVVLPIPIDIEAVAEEPSDSEIKQLYDEGKYDYPIYNFKRPGFKVLKKAKVQYFMAEMKTFLDNEIAKLSEEEIQAEYDRLLEAEDRSVMEMVPVEEEKTDTPEQGTEPENQEDPAPAPAESPNEDSTSAEETNETPAAPADDGEGEPAAEESSDEGGGYTSIKLQDDAPAESEQETPTESEPPAESETADPSSETAATESTDATTTESENESTDESETNDDDAPVTDSADEQNDPVIEDKPKTKLVAKPLTEVAEQIKRQMKIQDARVARDKALEEAEKEITFYQRDLSTYEMNIAAGKTDAAVKPDVPDFKAIADRLGIQFVETGLIDETEIGDEEIGKVVDISIGPGGQAQQINIGEQIFAQFENLPEYQVMIANDFMKSVKYNYWLAEKSDQRVPTLDEAKESIIEFWKRNKAIEAALVKAKAIADEINGGENQLLNEMHPEDAKLTGQFTWFSSFGRFAYGAPEGVTNPGEDFMGAAFNLNPKKATAALNETRDEAYVIQSIMTAEAETDLVNDYLEKNFFMTKQVPREVVSAKVLYRRRMNQDWLDQFRKEMDVKVVGQ